MQQQTLNLSVPALVEALKESGQDFEFYPTTDEIIRAVAAHLETKLNGSRNKFGSILDIGAGNGKVMAKLKAATGIEDAYAIEKSPILCREAAKHAFIIGTDVFQQSLIGKNVDVTFCNPPYSEFELWVEKIVKETNSKLVYLVIPERWNLSVRISDALKYREANPKILGSFNFINAERQARAVVDIVFFDFRSEDTDAFDRFFDSHFSETVARFDKFFDDQEKLKQEKKFDSVVCGPDFVSRLVSLYDSDIDHIKANYAKLGEVDCALLKEFGIDLPAIRKGLRMRLEGLKATYWKRLFDNARVITDRLTCKRRNKMLKAMNKAGCVEFTVENIHVVILWVIEHANEHMDEQLLETYDKMIEKANCHNYKSNQKVWECDRWRYNEDKPSHVYLDFRIVMEYRMGLDTQYTDKNQRVFRLYESGRDFLADMLTVSRNLGFDLSTVGNRLGWSEKWQSGKAEEFVQQDGTVVFEAKAFKNGNLHLRLSQKLALALNVEYGRLRGWLHDGNEAAEELGDKEAPLYFGRQLRLTESNVLLLTK